MDWIPLVQTGRKLLTLLLPGLFRFGCAAKEYKAGVIETNPIVSGPVIPDNNNNVITTIRSNRARLHV